MEVQRNKYHDDTKVIDGVRYTTRNDPNKLTNDDFLELLLAELKNQDPTKPKDTAAMMDSQLKMSAIEANTEMAKSMTELKKSYQVSSLSTASNLINHVIEDGKASSDGSIPAYKVASIKQVKGEVVVVANKITAYDAEKKEYTLEKKFTEISLASITKIF